MHAAYVYVLGMKKTSDLVAVEKVVIYYFACQLTKTNNGTVFLNVLNEDPSGLNSLLLYTFVFTAFSLLAVNNTIRKARKQTLKWHFAQSEDFRKYLWVQTIFESEYKSFACSFIHKSFNLKPKQSFCSPVHPNILQISTILTKFLHIYKEIITLDYLQLANLKLVTH